MARPDAGTGPRVSSPPYRPMVMESAPGKNPVSHTGKVYAVGAQLLAGDLVRPGACHHGARCLLLTRIGSPVDRPFLMDVSLRTKPDEELEGLRPHVERVVEERLDGPRELWRDLLAGRASALAAIPAGQPLSRVDSRDRP